jgi:hypothetical protein
MLAAKGGTDAPPKAVRDLFGAVPAALRNHKGSSVVTHGQAFPVRWTIAQ